MGAAMLNGLPSVADELVCEDPSLIKELSADGMFSTRALAIGAWEVLTSLIKRGDPVPGPPRALIEIALADKRDELAKACLARCTERRDVEDTLKGRFLKRRDTILPELLAAQWQVRAESDDVGP